MDTLDDAKLAENAIFRCDITGELLCSICILSKIRFSSKHTGKSDHFMRLVRFRASFVHSDARITCKTCESEVKWKEVKEHAESHKIVPWYQPQDKFESFYKNHTFKLKRIYYCYLCDRFFHDWYFAWIHFDEETHVNRKKGVSSEIPANISEFVYKDWIVNGFVPSTTNKILCTICKAIFDVGNIDAHRKFDTHIQKKIGFCRMLRKRKNKDGAFDINGKSCALEKIPRAKSNVKAQTPKIISTPIPRPMICNFLIEPKASSCNGISSERKVASSVNVEPASDWYSDNFPEIDSKSRVRPRISPKLAKQSGSSESTETFRMDVNYVVHKSHRFFKLVVPVTKQTKAQPDLYCLICSTNFTGTDTFNHLSGKRHKKTLEKYGCDNIMQSENAAYYCKCCDRRIDDLSKLRKHLTSESHLRISREDKNAQNNERPSPNDEKVVAEIQETEENGVEMLMPEDPAQPCEYSTTLDESSMLFDENSMLFDESSMLFDESPMTSCQATSSSPDVKPCLYIIRQNAKKSLCQICDIDELPIATKKIIEHTQSQRHTIALKRYGCDKILPGEDGNYRCACCNVDIEDLKKVFLHIKDKKHTSSLIKVKDESRRSTKIVNRTFSPDRIVQAPMKNFLSDYIANINSTIINGDNSRSSETRSDRNNVKQSELSSILTSMASEVSQLCKQIEETKKTRHLAKDFDNGTDDKHKNKAPEEKWVENIFCPICACNILHQEKLHIHMANHFQDDFTVAKSSTNHADSMVREIPEENHEGSSETICNGHVNGHADSADEIVGNGETTPSDSPKSSRSEISPSDSPKSFGSVNSLPDLEKVFEPERSNSDSLSREGRRDIANADEQKDFPVSNEKMEELFRRKAFKKAKNPPRKFDAKKVMERLNLDVDTIYDLREKLSDMEFGFKLSLVIDSKTIYCLICRKTLSNTLQNYYDHLWSVLHCENLDMMEQDNALFDDSPNEFSDLKLAQEYMEEVSDDRVHCFICDKDIINDDSALREHIYERNHERTCETMISNAAKNFHEIKSRLKCDWYTVENYWCVPCFRAMANEISFFRHLEGREHKSKLCNRENRDLKITLDYCSTCSLLLCGYRATYAHHTEISTHKWLERDGYYVTPDLPEFARILLADPDQYVNETIDRLDEIAEVETAKEERLIHDLKEIVAVKFPRVAAYTFGSRVSGLGSKKSDIDIFLDCRNMYDGKDSSTDHIEYFIKRIHLCLTKHPECWDVNELLLNCRAPIIRAYHRATGLACDISVENGLSVENTKLVRSFNTNYPPCRKLMLILKQWLAHCDLSGSDRITSYALCWLVIFYLQTESILPSVATLIKMKGKSRIVGGWETGVTHKFSYWEPNGGLSITKLLKRFFAFYADFDYRHDVVCPLLGEIIKKRDFFDPSKLPAEMTRYVLYTKRSRDAEPFRIDSAMCIQDPFDLRHNLTKAVSKYYLNRFRVYCSKSFNVLSTS